MGNKYKNEFFKLERISKLDSSLSDNIDWRNEYHKMLSKKNLEIKNKNEVIDTYIELTEHQKRLITDLENDLREERKMRKTAEKKAKKKKTKKHVFEVEDNNTDIQRQPGHFDHGVGLTIVKGKEPELRRLNPSPRKKIDGIEIEVSPGRGFRIGPHRKD